MLPSVLHQSLCYTVHRVENWTAAIHWVKGCRFVRPGQLRNIFMFWCVWKRECERVDQRERGGQRDGKKEGVHLCNKLARHLQYKLQTYPPEGYLMRDCWGISGNKNDVDHYYSKSPSLTDCTWRWKLVYIQHADSIRGTHVPGDSGGVWEMIDHDSALYRLSVSVSIMWPAACVPNATRFPIWYTSFEQRDLVKRRALNRE